MNVIVQPGILAIIVNLTTVHHVPKYLLYVPTVEPVVKIKLEIMCVFVHLNLSVSFNCKNIFIDIRKYIVISQIIRKIDSVEKTQRIDIKLM